jgi:hypothetical protein
MTVAHGLGRLLLTPTCLIVAVAAAASPIGFASADPEHVRLKRAAQALGKRITQNLVDELGKRPKEMYSFGIGKRSISNAELAEYLNEAEADGTASQRSQEEEVRLSSSAPNALHAMDKTEVAEPESAEKRSYPSDNSYSFGLGKRSEWGLGRRDDPYGFGLGKRDPYGFGLGKKKRDPYGFGLGKRDPYGFGLGKRDPYGFGLGKRDPYGFGLGKRDPSYGFGLGKRDPYGFGLGKRDPYGFGLGKRGTYGFALGRKRDPYAFGLGK